MGCLSVAENMKRSEKNIHWPTALQFGLSLLAILFLWSTALSLILMGVIALIDPSLLVDDARPLLLLAAGSGLSGVLLVPSALFSFLRLIGRPHLIEGIGRWLGFFRPGWLILLLPLAVFLGDLASKRSPLYWLFLPPLHLLAIGLPVLWLAYIGIRGVSAGSPQRDWGALASGLVLAPFIIFLIEIIALGTIVLMGLFYISLNPDLASELANLAQRLSQTSANPQIIRRILTPHLLNPTILFTMFAFVGVIVPLVEEAIKPIGVWLLAGSKLSPASGFTAGILCGVGYALFESLVFASSADNWALVVGARMGTAAMHIATTGLTGWALAYAWRYGRYFQLGLAYLAAVAIHSLWNGLTLLGAAYQFIPAQQLPDNFLTQLARITPLGLGVLAFLSLAFLLLANWRIKQSLWRKS